jgi:hypothetical protein
MSAHLPNVQAQAEAVRKARAIVAGEVGVLEGCISLSSWAHDVVPDWRIDPDFIVFGAVASEIDDLPFGPVRANWSGEALAKADQEIARYTQLARAEVLAACRNIIIRFAAASSHDGAV